MSEKERDTKDADEDRRRFLVLAGKLGVAVPPVVALTLSKPSYAAGSGFKNHIDSGRGNGSSPVPDQDPGNSGPVNQGGD
jgi:hypothetical protein